MANVDTKWQINSTILLHVNRQLSAISQQTAKSLTGVSTLTAFSLTQSPSDHVWQTSHLQQIQTH